MSRFPILTVCSRLFQVEAQKGLTAGSSLGLIESESSADLASIDPGFTQSQVMWPEKEGVCLTCGIWWASSLVDHTQCPACPAMACCENCFFPLHHPLIISCLQITWNIYAIDNLMFLTVYYR